MARRPRKPRLDQYEAFKKASGWYLAAWRDHRGLTLEELAAEVDITKGMVSDFETGALKSNGTQAQRFNRDWVDKFAKALGTTGGYLIDINPFGDESKLVAIADVYRRLSDADREVAVSLVSALLARTGTDG